MTYDFQCPWCGAETKLRGADGQANSWRFRLPCELCDREMIVTWDGALFVGRAAGEKLSRSEDVTVRIRLAKTG